MNLKIVTFIIILVGVVLNYFDLLFEGDFSFYVNDLCIIVSRCIAWVFIGCLMYKTKERVATIACITYTATLAYDIPDYLFLSERYNLSIALSLVPIVFGLTLGLWLDYKHSLKGLATEYVGGIVVAFFRPSNFWQFLTTWNGTEVSGCALIANGYIYTFQKNVYTKVPLRRHMLKNMIFVPVEGINIDSIEAKRGSVYNPASNNCASILSSVTGKEVILPNLYLKQLLSRR